MFHSNFLLLYVITGCLCIAKEIPHILYNQSFMRSPFILILTAIPFAIRYDTFINLRKKLHKGINIPERLLLQKDADYHIKKLLQKAFILLYIRISLSIFYFQKFNKCSCLNWFRKIISLHIINAKLFQRCKLFCGFHAL